MPPQEVKEQVEFFSLCGQLALLRGKEEGARPLHILSDRQPKWPVSCIHKASSLSRVG